MNERQRGQTEKQSVPQGVIKGALDGTSKRLTVDEELYVSKSQKKREAQAILALARQLVDLPEKKLISLRMEEDLLREVRLVRGTPQRIAHKRALHHLAKLLRNVDTDSIAQNLTELQTEFRTETAKLHHLEQWRERLINQGETPFGELLALTPDLDRQHWRNVIRQARKEQKLGRPPTAARKLFKMLRDLKTLAL